MNDYYDELKDLIKNNPKSYKSHLMLDKKYILDWIYQKTKFTNGIKLKLATLIYLVLNNFNDFPKCCVCNKNITKDVFSVFMGYNQHNSKNLHCSCQCAKKDPDRTKKYYDTCMKKYGVNSPNKTQEQKDKAANTKLVRYGNKNYSNNEKRKQTVLLKYGVEYVSQLDIFKQKALKTIKQKYNTNHITIPKYRYNDVLIYIKSIKYC